MAVLVGEYPTNLLQKLPVAKYLSTNVFLWGCVIACSAAAENFRLLMVVRFLLGMFESCVQPSFIIMTTMWYTKREQAVLTSLWYCMTGVQLMVGGIIAWGTSHYTHHTIYSWQLLFLVLGCVTCVWAVFIGWWLPDSPMKAKCFTEDQKRLIIERVRANETGIQNKTYKSYQMLEEIKDPVIWCYIMLQITSTLVISGLGVFSNLIIASFGFSVLETQLLNIAQGAVTIIVMIGGATLAQTTGQTILVMHAWTVLPIVGTAIIYAVPPDHHTSWTSHRFLLYAVLSRPRQLGVLLNIAKRGRSDQEIDHAGNDLRRLGSRQYDRAPDFPSRRRSPLQERLYSTLLSLRPVQHHPCHSSNLAYSTQQSQAICCNGDRSYS